MDQSARDYLQSLKRELLEELSDLVKQDEIKQFRRWLKAKELIAIFNISPATMHSFREQGLLPGIRIKGMVYYDILDIEKMLAENKMKPTRKNKV